MAEMNKMGRCWKGYKPKPGSKAYSKGSCIPEAKKMGKVNPWAVCTASTGREDKAKYERCVKAVKKESYNPVEDAEAADFGGKPLVRNPIRPKGDNLVHMKKNDEERAKKKKVTESPDPRSKLGRIQHDQGTAWVKKKNDEDAEEVGGHDKLRQIRSDELKAKLQKKKVTEATDEDRMKAALEDEERVRKLKGKKPTPKALRRIPGTDEYVK